MDRAPVADLDLVQQAATSEAWRLRRRGIAVDPADLLGAAWLALEPARESYRRQCRWSGYAVQAMRYAIRRDLAEHVAKEPESVRRKRRRMERAEDRLSQALGRRPSEMELAVSLGMRPVEVDRWRCLTRAREVYRGTLPDPVPSPDARLELEEAMAPVLRVLATMPESYRCVVQAKYLEDQPNAVVAERAGLKDRDVARSLSPLILRQIRRRLAA